MIESAKLVAIESSDAAIVCANPNVPVSIFRERLNLHVGQTVSHGEVFPNTYSNGEIRVMRF